MPKIKNIEKRIWDIEEFSVVIRHADGRDMRSDRAGLPHYPAYERRAKNNMTVSEWKANRFYPNYPGFEIDVLDGDGNSCTGNTKLGTVRDSYEDD